MTIYIDCVFLLNLFFDFLLILTVNNTLKRNTSLKRIFFGALIGSTSILSLFFSFTTFSLFLFKILLSVFMCGISFGWKDKTYMIQNISYFYMTSTVLGGFLYFLQLEFSESQHGLIFTYSSLSVPYLFLVIISPIMLYIYFKQQREKVHFHSYFQISVTFLNGHIKSFRAYLDTGNKLVDPITKKKIILIQKEKLELIPKQILYVPYHSLNHHGLIACFPIDTIEINGKKSKNYLVGMSDGELLRDGIECVLNSYCQEEFL